MSADNPWLNPPPFRQLRGYAFDPSLSLEIETVKINEFVYKIPWEDLKPGPSGEYIEVIDYDPSIDKFYKPVDLNHRYILAQDGLAPSESNPQFHQQMVYAVAMITINNFESALGRKILWAPRLLEDKKKYEEYVEKLRIYPHALREANAYYSPQKKSLLFGYFTSSPADSTKHLPGSLVFTCLSHDIIAHETTHAILDGMQRYYNEPSNPDVLAFHEAFSDIVALFQHFTFPDVIKHQIAETRGDLSSDNLLVQLAHEFGAAIGKYGSLRDAVGGYNQEKGKWEHYKPTARDYETELEPHSRGSILVAAVFDAFTSIYNNRIADLKRIASNGTGILPRGNLHPDLVDRLAEEASRAAKHVLYMCIRGLDYCPPADITFGEFLRAIISADMDVVKDDDLSYRLSFIDAFRKRGIYPKGIKTLSIESLSYGDLPEMSTKSQRYMGFISEFLKEYMKETIFTEDRRELYRIARKYISGYDETGSETIHGLHKKIYSKFEGSEEFAEITGVVFLDNWRDYGISDSGTYGSKPSFQIQNLRHVSRVGPAGQKVNQIVFSIVQRSGILMKNGVFHKHYLPSEEGDEENENKFELRGGCTLIYDLDASELKYIISKPLVVRDPESDKLVINKARIEAQYQYMVESSSGDHDHAKHFNLGVKNNLNEPFFLLHQ